MKNIKIILGLIIPALIIIGTGVFISFKIRGLQEGLVITQRMLNEKEIKISYYSDSFDKIMATNILKENSFTGSVKVGVKINDYGCVYCSKKILSRLKESFDSNTLIVILNTNSQALRETLKLDGYKVLIDTLQCYNFKRIEPVIFLRSNTNYIFPYSPEMVLAPELFDLYIDKIQSLISN